MGTFGGNESVDRHRIVKTFVHDFDPLSFKLFDFFLEIGRLQGQVMKSFATFFEELGKKSVRINRFQQLDTEIVLIKECNTKVSRGMFPDRAKFSAEGFFKKRPRGVNTADSNADMIEPTDGFIRHV